MGNRGFVRGLSDDGVGVYLHWNGGRDSVEAFLRYCELKGCRGFGHDDGYAAARLAQVIANYFGGTLSVGVYPATDEIDEDNGVYVVDGWKIVERRHFYGYEQREYDLAEMMDDIDFAQPEKDRLGEILHTVEVPTSTVKAGDRVVVQGFEKKPELCEVVGIGRDCNINGRCVKGLPYVGKAFHKELVFCSLRLVVHSGNESCLLWQHIQRQASLWIAFLRNHYRKKGHRYSWRILEPVLGFCFLPQQLQYFLLFLLHCKICWQYGQLRLFQI
ncbi:MAG: hypothetical protein SPD11_14605 [Sphaerochaetaceae bacterium]|nr:hypothetical protein [Sphaerochaetaceae bacterium]